ncbi:MAG: hypothetical protein ED559_03715 [Phycisphaera sp.]|nr:MAG: hypothetical protein ED559_03715 [Phycisphaera sp.]
MRSPKLAVTLAFVYTAAANAQDVTFSFAANDSPQPTNQSTFAGSALDGGISSSRVLSNLLVESNVNRVLPLEIQSRFNSDFQLTFIESDRLTPNGQYLHSYFIDGSFWFDDDPYMVVTIENGVFTTLGEADRWGTAASIVASSDAGSIVSYEWLGDDNSDYSLFQGVNDESFSDAIFSLTNITSFPPIGPPQGTVGVDIDLATGLPEYNWTSDASFAGSTSFVPSPGSALVFGCGVLAMSRRKRRQ